MAMMGEVGELCEIFQWRGSIADMSRFESKELIHLGEEIADVFIYNARLADLCGIDLVQSIVYRVGRQDAASDDTCENIITTEHFRLLDSASATEQTSSPSSPRVNMTFAACARAITGSLHEIAPLPPRHIALAISATAGSLCHLMGSKREDQCLLGLPSWPPQDIHLLALGLAEVACQLITLASLAGLDVGQCVSDKLKKNAVKYPVHLVSGSSAKYTAYTHMLPKIDGTEKEPLVTTDIATTAEVNHTSGINRYLHFLVPLSYRRPVVFFLELLLQQSVAVVGTKLLRIFLTQTSDADGIEI
jgi:NTP pyrophosphatase (non-canonical NTP hydrolase)